MKKPWILYVIVMGLLIGCAHKEDKQRFFAKDMGFSVTLPAHWEVKENFAGIRLMVLSPLESERDIYRENMSVMVEELTKEYSLSEFVSESIETVKANLSSFEQVAEGKASISGAETHWISYRYEVPAAKIQAVSYLMVKERAGNYYGYFITCSSTPQDYEKFAKEFEARVNSFQFEKMEH